MGSVGDGDGDGDGDGGGGGGGASINSPARNAFLGRNMRGLREGCGQTNVSIKFNGTLYESYIWKHHIVQFGKKRNPNILC